MSFLSDMLKKLTDVFVKNEDSNIGKLLSIVSDQVDDLNSTLDRMDLWRDIDEAEGVVLDRIGNEILQEPRGGISDDDYRLKLKTRIVINYLSDGDIESLIKLLEVYLGDYIVSVQTAANTKDGPFAGKPATLLITIDGHNESYGIPFEELARVISGGVSTQWQYILKDLFTTASSYERWLYPFENFTGDLITGGDHVPNGNKLYLSNFELDSIFIKIINPYPVCGDFSDPVPNNAAAYQSNFQLSSVYYKSLQPYQICGNFVAGEVV